MADAIETKREEQGLAAPTMATPVSTKMGRVADIQDIGAAVFAKAANYCSDTLEADKASVRKKLDKILMPMVRHLLHCQSLLARLLC
jgi:hypothetical protein